MAGWLYGYLKNAYCFVPPCFGFYLSLLCDCFGAAPAMIRQMKLWERVQLHNPLLKYMVIQE